MGAGLPAVAEPARLTGAKVADRMPPPMIRKLDRYVVSSFIPDFLVTTFGLSGMFVVVDLFQNLDDFIRLPTREALVTIVKYYALFVPIKMPYWFPAITLIATGMTLVRHSRANELLAMKTSGISIYRIVIPIFVCACVLGMLATLNREWLVPKLWGELDKLKLSLDDSPRKGRGTVEDRENCMDVRVWEFDRKKGALKAVDVLRYYETEDGSRPWKSWIKAERGEWRGNEWHLFNVTKHDFAEDGRKLGPKKLGTYIIETSLKPKDLEEVSPNPGAIGFLELRRLCREHPEISAFHLNFHGRIAFPLKGVVLLLIGIPFMVGLDGLGQSMFIGILKCLIVCVVFYTLGFATFHFGINGRLHPVLAAWLPTVMFGAIGLLLFDSTRT